MKKLGYVLSIVIEVYIVIILRRYGAFPALLALSILCIDVYALIAQFLDDREIKLIQQLKQEKSCF